MFGSGSQIMVFDTSGKAMSLQDVSTRTQQEILDAIEHSLGKQGDLFEIIECPVEIGNTLENFDSYQVITRN